jgi:uncharacterized protein
MDDLPLFSDLMATPFRFVWHEPTRTAILADLHLGALTARNLVGSKMAQAWGELVARKPRQVILAGDVMDDSAVGTVEIQACRGLLAMLDRTGAGGGGCRVIVTPGNHDPAGLGALLGVDSAAEVRVGRYLVSHGHELTASRPGVWIVGHQHPAVILRDRVRSARMGCYAVGAGSAQRPEMVLLPAFSSAAGGPVGTNLLTGRQWILPVPRPGAERIRVYGLVERREGEPRVLDFGTLAGLQG